MNENIILKNVRFSLRKPRRHGDSRGKTPHILNLGTGMVPVLLTVNKRYYQHIKRKIHFGIGNAIQSNKTSLLLWKSQLLL
jgi:hypothetical protein